MAVKTYQDSKDKYLKEKVDTFVLRVPKGKKDEIMEYAKSKGMSLNGYITELIFSDMGQIKENVTTPAKTKVTKEKTAAVAPKTEELIVKEEPKQEIKKKKMPSFLL